ncbi:MAG: hypothetical protein HQL92_07930 [Magnetococcales bacterium]|nr:hypothetical protein [Magnetococcales bacterium]
MNAKSVELVVPIKERPDPEVVEKARRRTFSAEYKRRILEKADRCTESGEIGSLLRREGLHSSHLTLRSSTHDSGPLWAANPSTYDSFIHNTSPVYPGAPGATHVPVDPLL